MRHGAVDRTVGFPLTLTAGSTIVPTGGTTEIRAFVAEEGGIAVQNGTIVYFATNLGRMEPAESQTRNGYAVATFVAGESAGVATVIASSGGTGVGTRRHRQARVTGRLRLRRPPEAIPFRSPSGQPLRRAVVLNASATSVPSGGGTVTLIASVVDINGNRLRNTPINFSTTAGTLSATVATTDASGEARVELNTNRNATVTARAGSKSATLEITVSTPATLLLGANPSSLPADRRNSHTHRIGTGRHGNRLATCPSASRQVRATLSASLATTDVNGEARVGAENCRTATVTATRRQYNRTTTVNVAAALHHAGKQ